MSKAASIFLILFGIVFAAWQFQQYGASGVVVKSQSLEKLAGNSESVQLDPSMNPLRLILTSNYDIKLELDQVVAFSHSIKLIGPGGLTVFAKDGYVYPPTEQQAETFSSQTSHTVLGTFTVGGNDGYILDWRIEPHKAKITDASLIIRRNASGVNYLHAAIAVLAVFFGLVVAILRRRK